MVELEKKYEIVERRFGFVNWIGIWTLYKKEVLRFLVVFEDLRTSKSMLSCRRQHDSRYFTVFAPGIFG